MWKFLRGNKTIIKTNHHCSPNTPIPSFKINVGDKFIDSAWEENIIEIVKISVDKKFVKYKFITIEGKKILNSLSWTGDITLFDNNNPFYKKYTNE